MNRRKWPALTAVALVLVGAITWYFAAPYYTLMQMRDAAKAKDAHKLSAYIDYPALREDLKSEFTAHLAAEARKDDPQFGPLGLAVATAMIGPVIDGMVSPAGIRAMLTSKANEAREPNAKAQRPPVQVDENPIVDRRSFSEFAVRSKDSEGAMIFTRHGLGWKLSGVELPPARQE